MTMKLCNSCTDQRATGCARCEAYKHANLLLYLFERNRLLPHAFSNSSLQTLVVRRSVPKFEAI